MHNLRLAQYQVAHKEQTILYAHVKLDDGHPSDGEREGSIVIVGVCWNPGEITEWAVDRYHLMQALPEQVICCKSGLVDA